MGGPLLIEGRTGERGREGGMERDGGAAEVGRQTISCKVVNILSKSLLWMLLLTRNFALNRITLEIVFSAYYQTVFFDIYFCIIAFVTPGNQRI